MNKSQPFRQHQLTRALKAARAAGGANPHVRVVLPNGTQLFLSGGEVEVPKKNHSVPDPGPKSSSPVRSPASLARGGKEAMGDLGVRAFPLAKGGSSHGMVKRQAADPARPGRTGKPQSAADTKQASGGLSSPAKAGQCGT
jgi:hypothetical protein